MRRVDVLFRPDVQIPADHPQEMNVVEQNSRRLGFTWAGTVASLLTWLQQQPLDDVAIGPPSLEELFLTYYRDK